MTASALLTTDNAERIKAVRLYDASGNLITSLGGGGGGGGATTVADGADVTQGAKADAAYAGGGGSASEIAILKGLYEKLSGTLSVNPSPLLKVDGNAMARVPTTALTAGGRRIIGQNTTAASVVPVTFTLPNTNPRWLYGGVQDVTGTDVATDSNMDLFLFLNDPSTLPGGDNFDVNPSASPALSMPNIAAALAFDPDFRGLTGPASGVKALRMFGKLPNGPIPIFPLTTALRGVYISKGGAWAPGAAISITSQLWFGS